MKLTIPIHINPYALACLKALQKSGPGKHISLGGAFALALYHEFRSTKDDDAKKQAKKIREWFKNEFYLDKI